MDFDELDRNIIELLRDNARRSRRKIAEALGVSTPTISSRLTRLEDLGVIRGYTVDLDPAFFPSAGAEPLAIGIPVGSCVTCAKVIDRGAIEVGHRGRHYLVCCKMCEKAFHDRIADLEVV